MNPTPAVALLSVHTVESVEAAHKAQVTSTSPLPAISIRDNCLTEIGLPLLGACTRLIQIRREADAPFPIQFTGTFAYSRYNEEMLLAAMQLNYGSYLASQMLWLLPLFVYFCCFKLFPFIFIAKEKETVSKL